MKDYLKILVDQLATGKVEQIGLEFDPQHLEVREKELQFVEKVQLDGQAYVANQELVVSVSIEAIAQMPCMVCNEWTKVPLSLKQIYGVFPLKSIKGKVFHLLPFLREELLLALPSFIECCKGKCPEREEVKRYLKMKKKSEDNEGYAPFKDLQG